MSARFRRALCRSGTTRRGPRPPTGAVRGPWLARAPALLGALAGVVLLGALAGAAGAATPPGLYDHVNETDTSPPSLVSGSAVDETTIELLVTDNHDVDEGSIALEDFVIPRATPANLTTNESGSDAVVRIGLVGAVDRDELYVALAENATISDTVGNSLSGVARGATVTVTGTDGVSPTIREFSVTDATGTPARIVVRASERLAGLSVRISGPVDETLDRSAFTYNETTSAYVATYSPRVDGNYAVRLLNATDGSGNSRRPLGLREEIVAELTPPETVAVLDRAASENRTLVFDAGRSTDPSGIDSFRWSFGDGTTAFGERVRHSFAPGNYTVRLRATDRYGNAATDSLRVNLTGGTVETADPGAPAAPTVTLSRPGDSSGEGAIVSVRGARRGVPVRIGTAAGGALLATDGIVVETVEVHLRRNASFGLALAAADPAAVPGSAAGTVLGGFTVAHDLAAAAVSNVTFRVSVPSQRVDAATAELALARRQGGEWTRLPTTARDGRTFSARSPGLSWFAVVAGDGSDERPPATPTPTAEPTATPAPAETPAAPPASEGGGSADSPVAVTGATLNRSRVAPGSPVGVNATVTNRGSEPAEFVAGLRVGGNHTATRSVVVPAGRNWTVRFTYATNRTGSYSIAVNGTSAGELTVGGGPLSTLAGFLPLGLLRPVLLFVCLPIALVYGILKALAIYLGY